MSARKGKANVVAEFVRPQRRPEPPQPTPLGERRLGGAVVVPIDQVEPDPDQPRRDWGHDDGERKLVELAASIREYGIFTPLLVREDGRLPDGRLRYIIIAGGRRRVAAERAGLRELPVIVRGDEGSRVRYLQLVENLQRHGLAPLDEARAYQELLDLDDELTPPKLAERVGVSAQHIRDRLRLLTDQVIADAVARGRLTIKAATNLRQLPDEELEGFKQRIVRGGQVTYAEVQAVRQRLQANGVINPRYKGGGRVRPSADVADVKPASMLGPRSTGMPNVPLGAAPWDKGEQDGFVPEVGTAGVDVAVDPTVPIPGEESGEAHAARGAPEQNRFVPADGDATRAMDGGRRGQSSGEPGVQPQAHPAALVAVAQQFVAVVNRAVTGEHRAQLRALANQITDRDDPQIWGLPLALGLWRSFVDEPTGTQENTSPSTPEAE
jgi:ParB/RepB/Spo0J family partition protein